MIASPSPGIAEKKLDRLDGGVTPRWRLGQQVKALDWEPLKNAVLATVAKWINDPEAHDECVGLLNTWYKLEARLEDL